MGRAGCRGHGCSGTSSRPRRRDRRPAMATALTVLTVVVTVLLTVAGRRGLRAKPLLRTRDCKPSSETARRHPRRGRRQGRLVLVLVGRRCVSRWGGSGR